MKKIIAMAAIALLMMTACSDDDTTTETTTPTEDTTLLKKVIATSEDGTVITTNYNYDGNKIISQNSSNGNSSIFTYTGNLITHVQTTTNSDVTYETTIEYNSNNQKISQISLSSSLNLEIAEGTKEVYTYNSNGTETFNQYSGDLESQTTFEGTGTITYNENENSILHEGMSSEAYTHTLDTKNNPMKNVLGYNEYMQPHLEGKHNLLTGFTTPTRSIYIFTYTYNSNNYPLTSVDKIFQMNEYVTAQKQYFYE